MLIRISEIVEVETGNREISRQPAEFLEITTQINKEILLIIEGWTGRS